MNEIRILASVRHPNIIRFRESFIENDTLFIVCPVHEQRGVCVSSQVFLMRLSRLLTLQTRRMCLW